MNVTHMLGALLSVKWPATEGARLESTNLQKLFNYLFPVCLNYT